MKRTIIVTGASGFLGKNLLEYVGSSWPKASLVALDSPRCGGIDLTEPSAMEHLTSGIHISNPREAILVHAAAHVKWDTPDGLLANVCMALNISNWAKAADIGFCVLVSGVNVYGPLPCADVDTPCQPGTFYGLGKLTAEHVWRLILNKERSAIVRLAGIWGWQRRPTLFWNRLLLAAAQRPRSGSEPIVRRFRSCRNYISVREASECLLQVGWNHMSGIFLGAGRDVVDTENFVKAVERLPGSRLSVVWEDDGGVDESVYSPSPELKEWLKSFPDELMTIWANKPDWIFEGS